MKTLASRHGRIEDARHYLRSSQDDRGLQSLGRGPTTAIFVALSLSLGVGAAAVRGVEEGVNSSPTASSGSFGSSGDR